MASQSLKRKREDEDGAQICQRGEGKSPLQQKRLKLLDSRKKLPIWSRQNNIRKALSDHQVLVLSGETGSGKSTQVPQFILNGIKGKIAVTQPRRVAAISLARRVAEEMGTPLGSSSPASKVGYSVRFDESTSPSTRIKFLTEGMLLQEMLRDDKLAQYGCVIVDEVHERSVNVDLILGFLKQLLEGKRKDLKVIIMSATADIAALLAFFSESSSSSDGLAQDVGSPRNGDAGEEDNESWNGFSDDDRESKAEGTIISSQQRADVCYVEGRQYPVSLHYLPEPTEDVVESALSTILQIHCKEPMPGDLLVFMTGQETIHSLQKLVEEYAAGLTSEYPRMLVLPLFAALPQAAQQRIFQPAPPNTRKVILSTNIAETSVTVPGVRFVVDTGKAKIKQFRTNLGLESLLEKPISRSSADQRKGRAGREAPGQCYRLYTQSAYGSLDKDQTPEILRCDLNEALLKMKARGVDDVVGFPFVTAPPREALSRALQHLYQLGALGEDGRITELGRQIARLPLSPALGRVIVEASKPHIDCLAHVIDIVAALTVENVFLNVETEEVREKAAVARAQLVRRQGDHLTLLAAVQAYAGERSDRRRWCEDHLISHRAMQSVMDVRKQLTAQLKAAGILTSSSSQESSSSDEDTSNRILRCFLHGFSDRVARLSPDKSYKTVSGNQTVAIHPSSVLFGRKVEALVYNEYVFTNKAYARGVSAIEERWWEEVMNEQEA